MRTSFVLVASQNPPTFPPEYNYQVIGGVVVCHERCHALARDGEKVAKRRRKTERMTRKETETGEGHRNGDELRRSRQPRNTFPGSSTMQLSEQNSFETHTLAYNETQRTTVHEEKRSEAYLGF